MRRGARKNRGYNKGYDTAKKIYALEIDSIIVELQSAKKERDTQVVLHPYLTCVRVLTKLFSISMGVIPHISLTLQTKGFFVARRGIFQRLTKNMRTYQRMSQINKQGAQVDFPYVTATNRRCITLTCQLALATLLGDTSYCKTRHSHSTTVYLWEICCRLFCCQFYLLDHFFKQIAKHINWL